MVKKVILSAVCILLAVAAGLFLGSRCADSRPPAPSVTPAPPEPAPLPEEPPVSAAAPVQPAPPEEPRREPEAPPAPEAPQSGYCLRDHSGHIAVFRVGCDTPEMIFDVPTRILPPADQERLREGVWVRDYEELTRLAEDYIS